MPSFIFMSPADNTVNISAVCSIVKNACNNCYLFRFFDLYNNGINIGSLSIELETLAAFIFHCDINSEHGPRIFTTACNQVSEMTGRHVRIRYEIDAGEREKILMLRNHSAQPLMTFRVA